MKKYFLYPFIIIVIALFLQIVFGPFIAAKLSTLPVVRKFNLIRQQAPIVINTREEVRVSDSEDIVAAFNKAKSKISTVVSYNGQDSTIAGLAVNLAPEGIFVTTKAVAPGQDISKLYVQAGDSVAKVQAIAFDPRSNLAILKTAQTGVAPASLVDSANISVGDRVVLPAMLDINTPYFLASFIASKETGKSVASADTTNRSFALQVVPGMYPGHAIVNLSGEVIGMWDGSAVIPSSVLRQVSSIYFARGGTISRPTFGFSYKTIPLHESKITGQTVSIQIAKPSENGSAVIAGSPADRAGLKSGDIITSIGNTKITNELIFETLLEKVNPGETVSMTILRGSETLTVSLQAGELK